jgi:DhnA family fructose-bisphosphate aldolase class Ia
VTPRLGADGRWVVVAIDHPLYSWPCHNLADRTRLLRMVTDAGADAVIASYGTIRDCREAFGSARPILKLDLTTVTVGGHYPVSEYVLAWSVDDARRLGVDAVLTYVQLGTPFELGALRNAARVAAACDAAGSTYLCEIMPAESDPPRAPGDEALHVAAACRVGAELGAHVIKTTLPQPPGALRQATGFGVPVLIAGGAWVDDREDLLTAVREAMAAGAAGVAFGRNAWGADDPGKVVSALRDIVHGRG